MPPAAPAASGGRALLALAVKLALVFGSALGVTLWLCSLLLQRVRDHDAREGLATSKLDALSVRSFSSLAELQRSHETLLHIFAVDYPLAMVCLACIYVMKQVRRAI
jgi:hypothetical protein